jgi:AcrR family transcriptional regulator
MSKDMRLKILEGASGLFITYGHSRVSMDELSEYLGISKKTIYNYFENKDRLVDEVYRSNIESFLFHLETIAQKDSTDFISKLKLLIEYAVSELSSRWKSFFNDVRSGEGALRQELMPLIRRKIEEMIRYLIREGRNVGMVRDDIPDDLLPYVYLSMIEGVIKVSIEETVPALPEDLLAASLRLSLEGVLTASGKQFLSSSEEVHEKKE